MGREAAAEIRASDEDNKTLAERYGVHRMTISAIVNYHRYNHLMPDTEETAA